MPKPVKIPVKPREPDMVVRDPISGSRMPPWGKEVPESSHWVRRLRSKDVVPTTIEDIAKGKAEFDAAAKLKAGKTAAKESGAEKPQGKSKNQGQR